MSKKKTKEAQERYNEKRRAKRAEEKVELQTKEQTAKEAAANQADGQAAINQEAPKQAVNWKNEKTKARAWAFIVYPESTPENWKEVLQQTGIQFAISPLHDSDRDPTEENKKPHWHVIVLWGNTTTGSAVRRITESVNAPVPIPLNGIKGYYRYFTHKDNPEKFQYDEKDIQALNGFNIADFVEMTNSEVLKLKQELQAFIIENNIIEYADLIDYLLCEGLTEKYDIATSHTYFFDKYISSRRNKQKEAMMQEYMRPNIDPETGEVLT